MNDISQEPRIMLPFDKSKQQAILGHLLKNQQFFVQSAARVRAEWFLDPWAHKVFAASAKFFDEYGRAPSVEEVRNRPEFLSEDQVTRNRINDLINRSLLSATEFGLDALRPELTAWLHSQYFEIDFRKAYQEYKNQNTKAAYSACEQMVEKIKTNSFDEEHHESFLNYMEEFEAARLEYSNALTFGIDIFDRLLAPTIEGTGVHPQGSLLPGDLSICLAPTNIGKTTSMVTTAVANIKRMKYVLFITHEGRPNDIKLKIRCCYLGKTHLEMLEMYKTPEGRAALDASSRIIDRFLRYVPLNKPGLTVEEVAGYVAREQEKMQQRNKGRGYDLLVDDYPAKITTQQAAKGMQKRERDEIVYNWFEQMGLKYKFHVLTAIQTNREGSKVNKGQREDRLLTLEDVAESWGPMTAATNVWTVNRSPHDKMKNRLVYYIDKSRSSVTGWAVVCKTRFEHAQTHSNELGGTFYQSASTYATQLDTLLDQYNGTVIPENLLLNDAA